MSRPSRFVVAVAVAALLLTGCSKSPTPPAPVTSSATPTTDTIVTPFKDVEYSVVATPDLPTMIGETKTDQDSRIIAAYPELPGYDALNQRTHEYADNSIAAYQEFLSNQEDDAIDKSSYVSVGWNVLGLNDHVIGVMQQVEQSSADKFIDSRRSSWYNIDTKKLLTLQDIVTSEGLNLVVKELKDTLKQHIQAPDMQYVDASLDDASVVFGFDKQGKLLIGFGAFGLTDDPTVTPTITITADPKTYLNEVGEQARNASMSPKVANEVKPSAAPATQNSLTGNVDCAVVQCVAITFDDGPAAGLTTKLLDTLKQMKAPATFFAMGSQAQAHPDIVQREIAEGHEVGNHSWSHPQFTSVSAARVEKEIATTQDILTKITGVTPTLVRPPYGDHNASVDATFAKHGLASILWNIDTLDWKNKDSDKVIQAASQAKPGSIVLMHDIHRTTVDAVPGVIDALRAKGYTLVTVSQLLGKPQAGKTYSSR